MWGTQWIQWVPTKEDSSGSEKGRAIERWGSNKLRLLLLLFMFLFPVFYVVLFRPFYSSMLFYALVCCSIFTLFINVRYLFIYNLMLLSVIFCSLVYVFLSFVISFALAPTSYTQSCNTRSHEPRVDRQTYNQASK